jgi:DNA helicase-2/ATP-dependent DNA helicase PcrA
MHVFEELGSPGLEEYLRELDERERSGHEPVQQAITLATVHGTKGLEWLEVFLVGLNDQLFPISHARKPEEIAEERRLFYVAVTRAKRKLVLSSPANRNPSEFVTELSGSRS